ncbi:hypothetical protein Tco_1425679, partial [Tanacetum coccineum]
PDVVAGAPGAAEDAQADPTPVQAPQPPPPPQLQGGPCPRD